MRSLLNFVIDLPQYLLLIRDEFIPICMKLIRVHVKIEWGSMHIITL